MAPPKKKETRGWLGKERIIEPRYSHRRARKRPDISRRVQTYQPIDVPKLVEGLLNIDRRIQGRRKLYENSGSVRGRMRRYRNQRDLYDTSDPRESSRSVEESGYPTESVATSSENLTEMTDGTYSSVATSSENSSVSNVYMERIALANPVDNTRALLKKKSLVQIINNYIRAGIEEGKRQAKKYIRKALSFGVRSGYLIPADPQGQVIRVSPSLVESRKADAESRKSRRRARRGEEEPHTSCREKIPRESRVSRKTKLPRELSADEANVPRRKKKRSVSIRNSSPMKGSKKKKSVANFVARERLDKQGHTSATKKKKSRERRKGSKEEGVERRTIQKGCITRSLSVSKGEKDNRSKSRRGPNERSRDKIKPVENETNQTIVTERRNFAECLQEENLEAVQGECLRNFDGENDEENLEQSTYENLGTEMIGK